MIKMIVAREFVERGNWRFVERGKFVSGGLI
jgi:hypothetical protein